MRCAEPLNTLSLPNHCLDSIINTAGVHRLGLFSRRQIQSRCFSVQHPHYLLHFWRWISPILPGDAQVENLEPSGFITSLLILACHWQIHFNLAQDRLHGRKVTTAAEAMCIWLMECILRSIVSLDLQNILNMFVGKFVKRKIKNEESIYFNVPV